MRNPNGTFLAPCHQNRDDYTPLHCSSRASPLGASDYRARLARKWGQGSNVVHVRADGECPCQNDDILADLDLTELYMSRVPATGTESSNRIAAAGSRWRIRTR